MWVLLKNNASILWLEFATAEDEHYLLPIFTSPDTAMTFLGEMDYKGGKVTMRHIDSVARINEVINNMIENEASAVILDPPHPNAITKSSEVVYWSGPDFCDILIPIVDMAKTYDEKRVMEVLYKYLNSKSPATKT